jgi:outer membrane protein assembly factor BamB
MGIEATDYRSKWRQRRHLRTRRRILVGAGVVVLGLLVVFGVHHMGAGGPVWRYDFNVDSRVYLAVDEGTIFCALPGRRAMALDAADGKPLWREPFVASRALAVAPCPTGDGAVYVTDSGGVIALQRETGQVLWQQNIGSPIRCRPNVHDGVVYVGADDGNMYAFAVDDGAQIWRAPVGDAVDSGVVVVNESLVSATISGKIFALRRDTGGVPSWETVIGLPIVAPPALLGERVVFGTSAGRAYLLDASEGDIIRYMNMPTYGLITSRPLTDSKNIYLASNDGWIVRWETDASGRWSERWRLKIAQGICTDLTMDAAHVYCGTCQGWLGAIDKADGRVVRRWECTNRPSGSVGISGAYVLVSTRSGEVLAFGRVGR